MNRVFLYGTLKRGLPNHGLLEDEQNGKAVFVAEGLTAEQYPLVVDTDFGIPFVLNSSGQGKNVEGEIWDVDNAMLKKLDRLEMHPDWYTRFQKEVTMPEGQGGKTTTTCWIYILCDFNPKLLSCDFIAKFSGSRYAARGDKMKDFDPWSFKK